jgi:hypothetical protein
VHKAMADRAQVMDSVPLRAREIMAAVKASEEVTGDDRREYAPVSAQVYNGLAALKARNGDFAGAVAALESGRNSIVPLRASTARYFDSMKRWYTMLGKHSPMVQASAWYNVAAAANANAARPTSGRVSLLVFVSPACGDICYPGYAVLQRLMAKHGSAGLETTLMARTLGYYRNRLEKPDSEMVLTKEYFMDRLKLPGALAVWKTGTGRRSDGRVTVQSSPNDQAFNQLSSPLVTYLVDRTGTIRMATQLAPSNEAMLDNMIAAMLH